MGSLIFMLLDGVVLSTIIDRVFSISRFPRLSTDLYPIVCFPSGSDFKLKAASYTVHTPPLMRY